MRPRRVTLGPRATDRLGHALPGVAYTAHGLRHEYLIDPGAAELAAERQVLLDPSAAGIDLPRGTLVEDVSYLERRTTDAVVRP